MSDRRRPSLLPHLVIALSAVTATLAGVAVNVASSIDSRWPYGLETIRAHPFHWIIGLTLVAMLASAVLWRQQQPERYQEPGRAVQDGQPTGTDVAAAPATTNRPVPAVLRNLPRDNAYFAGREETIAALLAQIDAEIRSSVPICIIDGMPGVGKTALAVHLGHLLSPRFPDGQLFVRLPGHGSQNGRVDPDEVLGALLVALGISAENIPQDIDERAAMWRSQIAGRRLLLILDDAASHRQVEPFLPSTAGCLVLITTRGRLAALPASATVTLGILSPDQTETLLLRMLGRGVDAHERAAVCTLAGLCGYLPLAACLVAGQLRHHPTWRLDQHAAKIRDARDRCEVLRAEDVTVRAVFDLSYRQLPASLQRFFRRLSLHPGAEFDAAAAAALGGLTSGEAAAALEKLTDEHLMEEPVDGRYRYHDLLHAYASALSDADVEADRRQAIDRLFEYYQRVAASVNDHLRGQRGGGADPSQRARAATWLATEKPNLVSCFQYARAAQLPEVVIGLAAVLADYFAAAGPWDEAVAVHRAAVRAAEHAGNRSAHGRALRDLGKVLRLSGDYQEAGAVLQQATLLFSLIGDDSGYGDALYETGVLRRLTDDWSTADSIMRQALEIFERLADRRGVAYASLELGILHRLADDLDTAQAYFARALQILYDVGDQRGAGCTRHELGILDRQWGHLASAQEAFERASAAFAAINHRSGEAWALHELGITLRHACDYGNARRAFVRVLPLFEKLGDRCGRAWALHELGIVHRCTDDHAAAVSAHVAALDVFEALSNARGRAYSLHELGVTYRCTGKFGEAYRALERAAEIFDDLGDRCGRAWALHELGIVHRCTDDYSAAVSAHTAALDFFVAHGDERGEGWSLHELSITQRLLSDYGAARDARIRAMAIFDRIGERRGSGWAWHELGNEFEVLGEPGRAQDAQDRAHRIFEKVNDRAGEARVSLAMAQLSHGRAERKQARKLYRHALLIAQDIGDTALATEVQRVSGRRSG
jgi:tetratricopeptide (TPR) repeat protein